MTSLLQDVRYALRTLGKSRGFAIATVATLALGIGANTAVFSVVRGVLWSPLPFREPDRLVGIWERQPEVPQATGTAADIADWQAQNRTFDAIAFSEYAWVTASGRGDPERLLAARVSPEFFALLGVGPGLGRTLSSGSDAAGNRDVVLSHAFWRRQFPNGREALGQILRLEGENYTVVGVMPRRFDFPEGSDFWIPLLLTPSQRADRSNHTYQVVGRLESGATIAMAQADLHAIEMELQRALPETNAGHDVQLLRLDRQLSDAARPALLTLFGAVAFVLLIACANVANLLLARTLGRRREMALRVALGAARGRIFRQVLTESVLLAGAGGGLGVALALWGLELMRRFLPPGVSEATPIAIDGGVLAFTLGVSVATGILFGLGPAIAATRPGATALAGSGNRSGGTPDRGRLRNLLVVAEIALALVLLVGAGLMLRSVAALQHVDPGFPLDGAATFELSLPSNRYGTDGGRRAFYREALQRLAAIPGATAAGATNSLPMGGSSVNGNFRIEGRPAWPADQKPITYYRSVTPDFFRASQIPIRRGRAFSESDREGAAPVALVNETMVRRFFSTEDPIGKRILVEWSDEEPWREIVGVVADIRGRQLDDQPVPETYVPYFQHPLPTVSVIVRTPGDPEALFEPIRRQVRALDADLSVSRLAPFARVVDRVVQPRRQSMLLLGLFGGLAILLAALGLSSVLAYAVAQRTREIGIRLAVGAQRRDILRLVLVQALRLARVGILAGLVGAFALTRVLNAQLYGIRATDPATLAAGVLLMAAVALAASALPARRASRVDPIVALRAE